MIFLQHQHFTEKTQMFCKFDSQQEHVDKKIQLEGRNMKRDWLGII